MPLPPAPPSRAVLQGRWIAGFCFVAVLMLGAGAWQHHLDSQNPANDQPLIAEMVSAKLSESDKRFYVVGVARYSLDGRSHETEFVDNKEFASATSAAARLQEFAPPRSLRLYCLRRADATDPCALSPRLILKEESGWSFIAVLAGAALLFAGACIWPVNTYARWAAIKAPDWIRALGFLPLYVVGVPAVVGLMFLFDWYWEF